MVVATRVPTQIVKRNGQVVDFDLQKIHHALERCFKSVSPYKRFDIMLSQEQQDIFTLVTRITNVLAVKFANDIPTVESVQDIVVFCLQASGYYNEAEHYIIYRHEHEKARQASVVPQEVEEAFKADEPFFPTDLQRIQFIDKYARWNSEKSRRETWIETVDRCVDFLRELSKNKLDERAYSSIHHAILNMQVMPSMRLLAMAGPAARRDNATIYNCSYLPIDKLQSFVDVMTISMAGSGVGFSVEAQEIGQLPKVGKQENKLPIFTVVVDDSAEGWAVALSMGLDHWFAGVDVQFDFSQIRPAGTPLKTKGGRASGSEPLEKLLVFVRERILAAQGRQLTSLEVHDIVCAIGNAVVSGGVRRTALISLFDDNDDAMLNCKSGDFERENNQRWNANNSMVWTNVWEMTQHEFIRRMWPMLRDGGGEPGIFVRDNAELNAPERRFTVGKKLGTNPCGEIVLNARQFCNLSAVIARQYDTLDDLEYKVEIATLIGTIQSMATYFPNLGDEWRVNCEEERLLGVDITGQRDNDLLNKDAVTRAKTLQILRNVAYKANLGFAQQLGIKQSAAITTVKPSGNTSVLVDCSSGLHLRWAPFYIRNIRLSAASPLVQVLQRSGFPLSPENDDDPINPRTWVASFPVKAPDGVLTRNDVSAIEQCNFWLANKLNWTEHNPSVTITYKPDEELDLINWVWEHRTKIGGMAFLPRNDTKYKQAPYIEITKAEYDEMVAKLKPINYPLLYLIEKEDHTTAAQELACSSGLCEV